MCNEQVVYCQHPKCGHITAHAQAPPIGNPAEPCDAFTKFLDELQRPVCPDDLPPFPCAALPVWRIPFDEYCSACLAARRPCLRSAAPKEVGGTVSNADDTRHSRGGKRGGKEPVELETSPHDLAERIEQERAAMILVGMKRRGERLLDHVMGRPIPVGRTIYNPYPATRNDSPAARVEISPQISTSRSVGVTEVDKIVDSMDWNDPPSLWRTPVEISTQYPVSAVRDTPGPGALPTSTSRLAPTTKRTNKSKTDSEVTPRRSSWAGTSATRMPTATSQDEVSSLASLKPTPALRSGTSSTLSPSPMPWSRGATEVTAATTSPHSPVPTLVPAPKPKPKPALRPSHTPNPAPISALRPTPTPKPVRPSSAAPVRKPPMASHAKLPAPSHAPETIRAPRPIAATSRATLGSSPASPVPLSVSAPQGAASPGTSTSRSQMRSLASILNEEPDNPPAYPPPLITATEARCTSQSSGPSSPAVASAPQPAHNPTTTLTRAPDPVPMRTHQPVPTSGISPASVSKHTSQSSVTSDPAVTSTPQRTRRPTVTPTKAPDAVPGCAPQPVPATKPASTSASRRTTQLLGSSSPIATSGLQRARRLAAAPTRAPDTVSVQTSQPASTLNTTPISAPQPTSAGPTLRSTSSTPNLRRSAVPIPEVPLYENLRPRSAIPQFPLPGPPGYPILAMPPLPPMVTQALRGIPSIFGAMGVAWFANPPMPPNPLLPMQGQRMMNAPLFYPVPPMPQPNPGTTGVQNVPPAAQTQPLQPQSKKGKQRAQEPPVQQPAQKPEKAQQPDARQQADKQTAVKRKRGHNQKAQRQAAQHTTQAEAGPQPGQVPSRSGHTQPQPHQSAQVEVAAQQALVQPIQDQGQPTRDQPARSRLQPTGPQITQPPRAQPHHIGPQLRHDQVTWADYNTAAQPHTNLSRVPQQQQRTQVHVVEHNVHLTHEQWAAMQAQTRVHQQTTSQQADQWRGWALYQFTQRQLQAEAGMSNQTANGQQSVTRVDTTGSQNEDTPGAGSSNAVGSTRRQRTQSSDQPTGQSPPRNKQRHA